MRRAITLAVSLLNCISTGVVHGKSDELKITVSPAAKGTQLVRSSLPLPCGFLLEDNALLARDGHGKVELAVRPLSWYPTKLGEPKSVRRAMVTFRYTFNALSPVQFTLHSAKAKTKRSLRFPVEVEGQGERIVVRYEKGPELVLRLLAPARSSGEAPRREVVESNVFYRWERFHLADPQWPRIIEIRSDALVM